MSDEKNIEMGKSVYETLCTVLDKMEIKYRKHEEELVVVFGHQGEDMAHNLLLAVNTEQGAIQMMERLPYEISEEMKGDVATAICYANSILLAGKFVLNQENRISFEITQFFAGSLIGEETIHRMLMTIILSVERYDDKFMALNKGYLKPEDFVG